MSEQAGKKRMIITIGGVATGTEEFSSELSRFLGMVQGFIIGSFPDFQPDYPPVTITTIANLEQVDCAALLHRLVNLPVDKVGRMFELIEQEEKANEID